MNKTPDLDATKRLMAALGRMPPKQHSDMKLGKPRGEPDKSPKVLPNNSQKKKPAR